ncbi:MAG: formate--tetrahydrofolate ligase [Oscillospiraceae bacterium]|jgi:formate--tetrahydrofolate ligase|nr:formate--tetrahydrofolate ligase [Oscillospiraceae bacterium]
MRSVDLDIARRTPLKPIAQIAAHAGLPPESLIPYGLRKAKINPAPFNELPRKARLVLVTAINPTPAGEGKTTVSIGLTDALRRAGLNSMAALREPSLGPVFGVKGGATGGGWAQVGPMADINLHFTGDLHAVTAANNLLAAMLDNSISQGNPLNIDPRQVSWRRCMDMNDRQLRRVVDGLGGKSGGLAREDGFDITAASEVMAVFCLARDLIDLKSRLSRIEVARSFDGKPVTCGDLKAAGAMTALLRDAFMPNLVQTLEGSPVLIHGGPFANIAHGCNSAAATELGLRLSDVLVTEAGFGADLGAEKFIDIKCRSLGIQPDCVVLVATVRALKYHGGASKESLGAEDPPALQNGLANLERHVRNITLVWGLPVVVAVNRFPTDTGAELEAVEAACRNVGARVARTEVWARGGAGGESLASEVMSVLAEPPKPLSFTYNIDETLVNKVESIAKRVYGASEVRFASGVKTALRRMEREGARPLPVCVAKTQYSFTDDPSSLGAPDDFILTIREARYSRGAGFVVVFAGEIIAMPGLPKVPAAEGIDVDESGEIVGIF